MLCILSWRIFWMTMMNRSAPDAPPERVFTKLELRLLDALVKGKYTGPRTKILSAYLTKVARLGGYLARANDPPPATW